jgi:DNA-binding NarL/FixJ family response regulator
MVRGVPNDPANKEIALNPRASESLVKTVDQDFFHKAGVQTRCQLVMIAIGKHSIDWLNPQS